MDGFKPDRWDLRGALICVAGVVLMVAPLGDEATLFTEVRGRVILRSSQERRSARFAAGTTLAFVVGA